MTVTALAAYQGPFFPNGVTKSFSFTAFEVVDDTEVTVQIDGVPVDTSLYNVVVNDDGTGKVDFFTAPTGGELYLFLDPDFSQQTTLKNQGPYFQSTMEKLADRLALRSIWLKDRIGRTPVSPVPVGSMAGRFSVVMPDGSWGFSFGTGADNGFRADIASPNGAAFMAWKGPQTGTKTLTQAELNRDRMTVMNFIDDTQRDFIRNNDYASQDGALVAAGIQLALNAGVGIFPAGKYRVAATLIWPTQVAIIGAGRRKTTIYSDIIGGSLIWSTSAITFAYMGDLTLQGNAVAGALGNGHAIDWIDHDLTGGAKAPQQGMLYRVDIIGFNGLGRRDSSVGAPSIAACGIIVVNALQNLFRDVYISGCGHGFYFKDCENTRVENCGTDAITKFCGLVMSSENTIFLNSTLIDGGDSTTDLNYPATAVSLGTGLFCSYQNNGLVVMGCKFKNNRAGFALIQSLLSNNDTFFGNWIRADAITDVTHKGIYALRPTGLNIIGNQFHPATTAWVTKKYQTIEVAVTTNAECPSVAIRDNLFGDVSGMTIEYNIKIGGNSNARPVQCIIDGNVFGFSTARSSACVIEADIIMTLCSIRASRIANNVHLAAGLVTRNAGVLDNNTTKSGLEIGSNAFVVGAGAITANYSNISEGNLIGISSSYDPPSLAKLPSASFATPIQTTTVTGAALGGDTVVPAWSGNSAGVEIYAWVSAANTVSWYLKNVNGADPLDLAAGTATLRVKKSWAV